MRFCVSVVVLCLALALPAMATAAPRADLQVRAVSSPSFQEAPGSRLSASATVRNAGDRTAPPSRLGFYLSRDRRKGSGDFRLSPRPRVGARRPRSRARLLRTLTVPRGVPPGSYALVACADDTRRIRERRERNNCRSATRRIRIVVPTPIPRPAPRPPVTPITAFRTPFLTVSGPPTGTVTLDTTPDYSGTAQAGSAAVARVEAQLDNGGFSTLGVSCAGCGTAAASWTFAPTAPLADGPHTITFRAVDVAGRTSPTIARAVTVDTTRPVFTSISATSGSTSVTATFSEPLACHTVNASDFSAEIENAAVGIVQVAACSSSGATITLTLASAPATDETVDVTLSGVVSDEAGNTVAPVTRSDDA